MQSDNRRGILLMVASMALFAVEDMFIKLAAKGVPTGEIVLVAGLFGIPVFAALAHRSGKGIWIRAALHPAVLLRNLGEMVGSIAYVTAIATVPLPTVSAVLQAMPLLAQQTLAQQTEQQAITLVLYGDVPLIRAATLSKLITFAKQNTLAWLTMTVA